MTDVEQEQPTCKRRWRAEKAILGLDFLRFAVEKPCLYCSKAAWQHPFVEFSSRMLQFHP